jgi:DNA-binding MarR family transcriptional regulator
MWNGRLSTHPQTIAKPNYIALSIYILYCRFQNAVALDREGDALCRRELGISLARFLVLSVVEAYPGNLSQQAIADRLGLTMGTVSRQLDNAVAAGLTTVEVASHTRRENTVALTKAGTALVREGDTLMEDSHNAFMVAVTREELRGLLGGLRALLRTIEQ